MGYARSPFREFENYLRLVVGLDEDDIQWTLKKYNATFVTYELDPSTYTIKDRQEAVRLLGDRENTLQIECDDISLKTKLFLTLVGSSFGTLRFDEKSFLSLCWVSHHIGTIN